MFCKLVIGRLHIKNSVYWYIHQESISCDLKVELKQAALSIHAVIRII